MDCAAGMAVAVHGSHRDFNNPRTDNMKTETIPQLSPDEARIEKLQNRGWTFDLIQIWKTEQGFHIGQSPTMQTKWFPDLRSAIDELPFRDRPA